MQEIASQWITPAEWGGDGLNARLLWVSNPMSPAAYCLLLLDQDYLVVVVPHDRLKDNAKGLFDWLETGLKKHHLEELLGSLGERLQKIQENWETHFPRELEEGIEQQIALRSL